MTSVQQWRVERVAETGSTNADVAQRFRAGEEAGLVLVADHQTAGRGRLGREWVTSAGTSLTVSFLLTPDVPGERWGWLPLLTGLAAAAAVRRVAGVEASLKWPNDVLVEEQKLAGILLERVDREGVAAAVLGIGINCDQTADELPVSAATSLALATGGRVDRAELLDALIDELDAQLARWAAEVVSTSSTDNGSSTDKGSSTEGLRADYLEHCDTLGQNVRVAVPGGEVRGRATDVDADGRLVVQTARGEEHLSAGDVVHVRPEG